MTRVYCAASGCFATFTRPAQAGRNRLYCSTSCSRRAKIARNGRRKGVSLRPETYAAIVAIRADRGGSFSNLVDAWLDAAGDV